MSWNRMNYSKNLCNLELSSFILVYFQNFFSELVNKHFSFLLSKFTFNWSFRLFSLYFVYFESFLIYLSLQELIVHLQ